jgi:hypothetical protein
VAQCHQGLLVLLLIARNGYVNTRIAQITGDANFGHRDHAEARVFQFITDNLRNLFPQSFSNALRTMHNSEFQVSPFKIRWFQVSSNLKP